MTRGHLAQTQICLLVCVVISMFASPYAPAQPSPAMPTAGSATIVGHVHDVNAKPVANARVTLQLANSDGTRSVEVQFADTDISGGFRFGNVQCGSYTLRADPKGYTPAVLGPLNIGENEQKTVDVSLVVSGNHGSQTPALKTKPDTNAAGAPEFYDEPQFTVAGVMPATNSGGHATDTIVRTTEALAKATTSLNSDPDRALAENLKTTPSLKESELQEAVMRAPESVEANRQLGQFLATNGRAAEAVPYLERASQLSPGDAELHHLLASVDEKVGNPLQAVRQYQRAAELKSSETNLFDWGTELLSHRALEPATEVLSKGNRLYPNSVRMLVALGVTWYARGSYDQAAQCLISASDVNPDDPAPYLFLGRMQSVQTAPLQGAIKRLARFAEMQPNNALANYNYAVALWNQSVVAADSEGEKEVMPRIAQLIEKAIQLDPKFAGAYLQLGILDSHLGDFPHATAALQKAIETSLGPNATLAEAHYRLAQIYERTGDKTKAHQELELHTLIATQARNSSDRERQQVQEFVISLKNNPAENPAP